MIDAPPIAVLKGYNLTTGSGGRTAEWTAADWDRKVRHGVDKEGHGGFMPSDDFVGMSDQELADIVTYIRSFPPVDRENPAPTYGPMGKFLITQGKLPMPAERFAANTEHSAMPPAAAANVDFGKHMAQICTGCHRANFEGGMHPAAPPGWAAAANLTSGPGGALPQYDVEKFKRVMREGIKANGEKAKIPMGDMPKYAAGMTDTELEALFMYLQSLPPVPTGT
jgi:cytochrome c1